VVTGAKELACCLLVLLGWFTPGPGRHCGDR